MKNRSFKKVPGWNNFTRLYDDAVDRLKDGDTFVEVGCYLGCSLTYAIHLAAEREKKLKFFAVDNWAGAEDSSAQQKAINSMGGTDSFYEKFLGYAKRYGTYDKFTPIRKPSTEASFDFEDSSVDFLFLDAGHTYEDVSADIKHWMPKIKKSGVMAFHDYDAYPPIYGPGVVKAVNELIGRKNLKLYSDQRSAWYEV